MRGKALHLLFVVLLGASVLFAEQAGKPKISNLTIVPSEPVPPTGDCKSSTAGYLNKNGKTTLKNSEIGKFISEKLHDGYVLTMYPKTKNGIFVSAECTNVSAP